MNTNTKLAALVAGTALTSLTAQAGLIGGNATTAAAGGSWSTLSGDTLMYTALAAPNTGTTAQGNVAAGGGASAVILSETFTPGSSFNLAAINVVLGTTGGTATPTLSIGLYNVTGVGLGAGATYTPGANLLGGGNGFTFTLAGQNSSQDIFSFDNTTTSDQVSLVAGDTYAFEISTPVAQDSQVQWYRGGAVDTEGQMMGTADSTTARTTISALGLAGGAPRTGELAVYGVSAVPEPTTLALIGSGLVAAVLVRRKN